MAKTPIIEYVCGSCKTLNHLPYQKLLHLTKSPVCGNCESLLLRHYDKVFSGLDSQTYIHPLDRELLVALKRLPGVQTVLRALIRHSFELATRLHHQANFIRVGKKQLSNLFDKFEFAKDQLGLSFLPELYVYQDPAPNAYTFGVEKSFVAISTGCLELLEDEEILCVLAHELGHVQADHVLYKSASRVFGSVASTIAHATLGLGNLIVYPIQIALMRWDRASELSSDRAALLVVKNPSIVLSTLMKLSGGTKKMASELKIAAFIKQAESFEKMQEEGPLGKYITIFNTLFQSHPYTIWRAKELLSWVTTGNFLEILDGKYNKSTLSTRKSCVECNQQIKSNAAICSHCGHTQDYEFGKLEHEKSEDPPKNTDPLARTFQDLQDWYKRNFSA